MSFDVHVFDDAMTPLASGFIELIETNHWGTKIDYQKSVPLKAGLFGATLRGPAPAEPVNIYVDDTSGTYAPTTLGHFNGKLTAQLNVSLYPLPRHPGGFGAGDDFFDPDSSPPTRPDVQTPAEIARTIHKRVVDGVWSEAESVGVGNLVETVTRALNAPMWDVEEAPRLDRWCRWLNGLGIFADLLLGDRHTTATRSA